jgi:hypothetical protein
MNGTGSERYLAIYAGVLTAVFAGTVLSGAWPPMVQRA